MEVLESRQLRAFVELARHQSFTQAARSLHLTQSAVSHSIKALEASLDMALFERHGKVVRLTRAGTSFHPHALEVLERMQRAIDAVESIRHPGHGRISLGATTSICHSILPSVMREFRASFPHYEISISTADTRELLTLLGAGQIDVAVGMEIQGTSGFHFRPLFTDRIALAMSPVHPLAKQSKIEPTHLVDQDFILYSRESETYRLLARGFSEMTGRVRGHLQVGSMTAIKEMARIGLGIGLLAPWIAREELEAQTLITRPLPWKLADRQWGIYSASKNPISLAEQILFGVFCDVVRGLEALANLLDASVTERTG